MPFIGQPDSNMFKVQHLETEDKELATNTRF